MPVTFARVGDRPIQCDESCRSRREFRTPPDFKLTKVMPMNLEFTPAVHVLEASLLMLEIRSCNMRR
jgi:hypothetical protein